MGDTEDAGAGAEESPREKATVTNPPGTVAVTALMGGGVHRVELSAQAGKMTESELGAEILVVANLASQQAASLLHALVTEDVDTGEVNDHGIVGDLVGPHFMDLPSPEQAAQARAAVFDTRYASDPADGWSVSPYAR